MAKWARIVDSIVMELTDVDPAGRFIPEMAWVSCGDDVGEGWTYSKKEFSAPAGPTVDIPAALAAARYAAEVAGITVDGVDVATDRESQAMITGAFVYSQNNPDALVKFKAMSGWVDLDNATITAIANAVGAHVQACFATEAAASGTVKTLADVAAVKWP